MAGRAGIAERRLKPLWDAIDHRQYKPALKLATGLIAKHPDSAYLLALKALVLERLGKDEEAADLCDQAKASGPVDEFTLTTLQLVFQRLHKLEEATGCYEHACLKNPNNVELLTALFNCYVRQYVYIKQQQTAMKLYKLMGEERFLLWAICSIMLQVSDGNAKLLPLAEALLKKHVESHSLQELEGLLVYLKVLQQQQKHDTALAVLQGPLGNLFTITTDRLRLQGELLMHSHQYEHAVEVFQEILRLSSDDWAAFQMYIDAVLTLPIVAENLQDHPFSQFSEEEMGVKFEQVNAFILELQAMDTPDLRRGPFLAVLEVEKRRLLWKAHNAKDQQESPDSASVHLAQSILRYFERFGFMVSFASDVKEFLKHIHGAQKLWLAKALHQACPELTPAISPVKALRYRVSAFQVEYQLGVQAHVTDSDVVAQAVEIMHLYLRSIQLSVDLDPQENMPGEELLTLITDLLIQLYLRTQQLGYILEAILVLEFGLAMRRYNAQYKLLLVNLYLFLSAFKPAWDRYRSVDVKYILLESMSHHMFPGLVASMDWDNLDNMLQEISKFHGDYQREAADLIILAYRHNTYSKVLEFVAFKGRLERSFQHLVVRIESIMLSLKRKANKLEEFESALSSLKGGQVALEWVTDSQLGAVSFNEDLQTRPWWSPAPDECLLTGSSNTFSEDGDQRHERSEEDQLRREVRWKKALKGVEAAPWKLHEISWNI
ncbi:hypothetical protein CY35_02G031200 [Sphagnum magellanicum]|nr:hypothetical protein CY35_02G031200 [Sphagnum magellanicum]